MEYMLINSIKLGVYKLCILCACITKYVLGHLNQPSSFYATIFEVNIKDYLCFKWKELSFCYSLQLGEDKNLGYLVKFGLPCENKFGFAGSIQNQWVQLLLKRHKYSGSF